MDVYCHHPLKLVSLTCTHSQERLKLIESKCRNRSVEENLRIWEEMKKASEEGMANAMRVKINMKVWIAHHPSPCPSISMSIHLLAKASAGYLLRCSMELCSVG